jgi:hydrogenase/urease accessory protein HupE
VVLLGQAALIVGGLRVDYARYYLPLVFVGTVTTGILAGLIGMTITGLVHRPRQQEAIPSVLASR